MSQVIIYMTDEGQLAIVSPAKKALDEYGIKAIADKDVPAGKPYKIISVSDIPTDKTFRSAWTVDEADLTDGVGSESYEFPKKEEVSGD